MENIIGIDELEAFVLDFLAYRRERKMRQSPIYVPATLTEIEEPTPATSTPQPTESQIPHSIGKGWPHYKDMALNQDVQPHPEPQIIESMNDIIPTLSPIVADTLKRFGPPQCSKSLDHIIHQVIASAMALPPVNESMRTAELTHWGRVHLLQTVIELLIILHM